MPYTVKEVSKLSGVSVRTLHYYDEIRLLQPAYYGENGYRFYEEEQLLRLQQILFFRELDFTLAEIQKIMDSDTFNQVEALYAHKELLQQKAERLQKLMQTIEKTIHHLKGEMEMQNEELYYGFDKEQQKKYEKELIERFGKQAEEGIKQSYQNIKQWKKNDFDEIKALGDEINKEMTELLRKGSDVKSKEVQEVIHKHFNMVNRFYTPTKEVYSGLGQLYVDHPDFRKLYDVFHPQLAEYYRDAMKQYAEENL
jgi:DNA-binding transcriptional MerR regulator